MTNKQLIEEAREQWGWIEEGDGDFDAWERLARMALPLADALATADAALDRIATRVTPNDYDNPSSALEAIADAVESTGRELEGAE